MIGSTAVYLFQLSVLASVAAVITGAGLRRAGAPARFVWLVAMAWGPTLLVIRALGIFPGGASDAFSLVPVVELSPLLVGPGDVSSGLAAEKVIGAVWLLSGLALLAVLVRTQRGLLQDRLAWERTQVLGQAVFVSTDRGPAVAGVWKPWIVMPRWVLDLPEKELRMVIMHEEEHLKARDALLLGGALALVVLSAWNPVTWWQLRRLRADMEMDCDRRVLNRMPDRVTYGSSLLSVAARASGASLGLASFTERSLSLKRRILTMTARTSRWTAVGGGVLVVLGVVVGVQACGVEGPLSPDFDARSTDPANAVSAESAAATTDQAASAAGEPTFTPFTVAPSITNRDEVIRTMEAEYPPLLREAGVGGTVRVYFFIGEDGRVADVRVDTSSGHPALDAAALRVAGVYRFTPALNKDKKVPVWVSFPITFQVR